MPVKHDPESGRFVEAGRAAAHQMKDPRTGKSINVHGPFQRKSHAAAYRSGLGKGKIRSRPAGYTVEHDSMTQMDRLRVMARDRGLETRDPGIEGTMHEFKRGQLHSGSKRGPKVTSRKQAIAIGLSKQRRGDTQDYGTSEGAKKAAQTRGHGGGGTPSRSGFHAARQQHERLAEHHEGRALQSGYGSEAGKAHREAANAHTHAAVVTGNANLGIHTGTTINEAKRRATEASRKANQSSRSHDAATQWDRIRRKAHDRGLQIGDAGTSEGAKKAAQTRKAHESGGSSALPGRPSVGSYSTRVKPKKGIRTAYGTTITNKYGSR